MAYDPYGNQDTQPVESPFSLVGSGLKWHFLQRPSTWSGSEGVRLPFGVTGKTGKAFMSAVAEGYQDKGFWGATKSVFSSSKWMEGTTGRIGSYEVYAGKLGRVQRRVSKLTGMKSRLEEYRSFVKKERMPKPRPFTQDDITKRAYGIWEKGGGESTANWARAEKELSDIFKTETKRYHRTSRVIGKGTKDLKRIDPLLAKAKSKAGGLLAQKGGRIAAKWGIRGMKAASWVGAMWLFADISMMVMEPVGRFAVEQTNRLMERVSNRFMPELGGTLNAAYLSGAAATERQRAIQAISKSHLNARSAYGTEAMLQHS